MSFTLAKHYVCITTLFYVQGWRMLLESMIDQEYPMIMKMEVEAPMVSSKKGAIAGQGCRMVGHSKGAV